MHIKNLFKAIQTFRAAGVLGLNGRNSSYIQRFNKRADYPKADSKLLAKELAIQAGIPVPKLLGVIAFSGEIKDLANKLPSDSSFVLKPEHGSGGEGILVLDRLPDPNKFQSSDGVIDLEDIKIHMSNTLSGLYSLGGKVDKVVIEEKVNFDPVFKNISYKGIPDIRIIVFLGIPVMAMVRLPTKKSHGKANLHQGAIGVGINLKTGITRGGVQGSSRINVHPDTGNDIQNIQIPYWDQMLDIAAKAYDVFKLGYLGIDLVVDLNKGPLMLEANVRPGLAVQIANRIGLKNRLEQVLELKPEGFSPAERIHVAKEIISKI